MPVNTRKRSRSQLEVQSKEVVSSADSSPTFKSGTIASTPTSETSTTTAVTASSDSPVATKKRRTSKKVVKEIHSDTDSDYETIKVRKGHPSLRDPSELPIITKAKNGSRKVLWAKMDTGADVNIMAAKVVERLGLTHRIEKCDTALREIGGNGVNIDRQIVLNFWAGRKNTYCRKVEFCIPSQVQDTDSDGVADVLIGLPELRKYHMVMVDPDFCNDPEEGLEILAKRAREEVSDDDEVKGVFLGTKYPQVKVRK